MHRRRQLQQVSMPLVTCDHSMTGNCGVLSNVLADQCGVLLYLLPCDWEECSLDQKRQQYDGPAITVRHMHLIQIALHSNRSFCKSGKYQSAELLCTRSHDSQSALTRVAACRGVCMSK